MSAPKKATFGADEAGASRESGKHLPQTAKYDRKAIQARIKLEEWVYETLGGDGSSDIENTFGWGEGDNEDAPELDLDEVLEVDGDGEKAEFIRNLLSSAPKKEALEPFITELLAELKKLPSLGR